jgi:probable rRNA maturation factor
MIILRKPVAGATEAVLSRFVTKAARAAGLRGTVNILITTNRELQALNRRFRGKNYPTDVLSFPPFSDLPVDFAGDIAISAEIAARNAKQLGHPCADEIKVLILHGLLHLAGFDHERDNGTMARVETRLRRELKLPTALIERSDNGLPPARLKPNAHANRMQRRRPATATTKTTLRRRTP